MEISIARQRFRAIRCVAKRLIPATLAKANRHACYHGFGRVDSGANRPHSQSEKERMGALATFIATYGALVVFVGSGLEGETTAIMGGFLAHQGVIDGRWVFLAAFLGAFTADQALFFIGRRFADHPLVMRLRGKPMFAKALARIEASPNAFILAFRFLYGLRTVGPVAVGVSAISIRRFAILNVLAALLWAALTTGIGYTCGRTIEVLFGRFRAIEHKLMLMVAVGIAAYAVMTLWQRRKARAEA
jgi:membrane protein DedA with SNARE-associated domain